MGMLMLMPRRDFPTGSDWLFNILFEIHSIIMCTNTKKNHQALLEGVNCTPDS